jgi:hypothetical protein
VAEVAAPSLSPLSPRATAASSSTPVESCVEQGNFLQIGYIFIHSGGSRSH